MRSPIDFDGYLSLLLFIVTGRRSGSVLCVIDIENNQFDGSRASRLRINSEAKPHTNILPMYMRRNSYLFAYQVD
jgi:hypothetical protein